MEYIKSFFQFIIKVGHDSFSGQKQEYYMEWCTIGPLQEYAKKTSDILHFDLWPP